MENEAQEPGRSNFARTVIIQSVLYAISWGVLMWIFVWAESDHSTFLKVGLVLVGAITFGCLSTIFSRR